MANDPKKPIDEKVGAYDNDRPARGGGGRGGLVTIILVILAVLLILWLFTDIL